MIEDYKAGQQDMYEYRCVVGITDGLMRRRWRYALERRGMKVNRSETEYMSLRCNSEDTRRTVSKGS